MQQKLLELCAWLEPLIRPLGWHCAATGSALYGCVSSTPVSADGTQGVFTPREPEDLDVLLYRHHGFTGTLWRPFDVLLHTGLRNIEDCTDYPEFVGEGFYPTKDCNPRKVFRVQRNGIKIDFLCIDEIAARQR